ncbi:hypothetical protein JCM3770_001471 [Rhodotorula araucariae]
MSMSAPLPSTAFSAHPLAVALSLDALAARAPPSSSGSSTSATKDIFDELDLAAGPWVPENTLEPATSVPQREGGRTSPHQSVERRRPAVDNKDTAERTAFPDALSDSHRVLYAQDEVRHVRAEDELPAWMRETSGRVTALAVGRASRTASPPGLHDEHGGAPRRRLDAEDARRLVAGCEDGTVWVFAQPLASASSGPQPSPAVNSDDNLSIRRLSHDSLRAASPASPPPRSPLHSPPLSPPCRAKAPVPGPASPRLLPHRSSSSVSVASLASNATARTKRISSSAASTPLSSSGGGSTLSSYELVRTHSRPRKASATVSISTSSVAPTSHAHPHTSAGDVPELPLSPPLPSSPPLSPSAVSPTLPHFVFSSPSRPPSATHGALQSRKESRPGASSTPSAPTSTPTPGRRSHSRAKGSIASGIGLWEESSAAPSPRDEQPDPLAQHHPDGAQRGEAVEACAEEDLCELRPVLRVLTKGKGAVVALQITEGLRSAGAVEREAVALLVLRQSGHLSVISLIDGRVFGSCDVGAKVPSSSRASGVAFGGLHVAKVGEANIGVCVGASGTNALVPVDLDSLVAGEAVELNGPPSSVAVLERADTPVLIFTSLSGGDAPGALLARRISSSPPALSGPTLLGSLQLTESTSSFKGLQTCGSRLISWNEATLNLHGLAKGRVEQHGSLNMSGVLGVQSSETGESIVVFSKDEVSVYHLDTCAQGTVKFTLSAQHAALDVEALTICDNSAIFACSLPDGTRSLDLVSLRRSADVAVPAFAGTGRARLHLYRSVPRSVQVQVTAIKPLGSDGVLLGYSDGALALLHLASISWVQELPAAQAELNGAITLLDVVEFGGRRVVVAGSATGAAGVWNLSDWDVVGRWQLFASPVRHQVYLDSSASTAPTRLGNTIAFISANSPVALVSLFPPALLFTLPGTKSAVELLATTKDEILVVYEQGLARTCDIKSRELRRSMDRKTAEGVLQDGSWTTWFRLGDAGSSSPHPLLSIDLRPFLDDVMLNLPWAGKRVPPTTEQDDTPHGSPDLSRKHGPRVEQDGRQAASSLIAEIAPFGLDDGADEMLSQLGVEPPEVRLRWGLGSVDGVSFFAGDGLSMPWTVSPVATAQRLLQLVCLLRIFLNYPETERVASEAILYYASCLADTVGPAFCPPSLDVLAQFWLDKNAEVQQAARSLFGTYLAAMPDDRITALVEVWQDQLPARQQGEGMLHYRADHALLVVGLIAVERFKLLSSSMLVDVAASVAIYLDESAHPYHQAVAAELCSRGFAIWQNYVDAMALVRALFALAIGRNPATPNDLRILARNATLHVAGINTPLFMTTLLHDILNASTASSRNATLKLLGFLIRKKPLVLYSNLPRVVEAVVKSLDPTISALRETVQQSATFILNELVRTFPSIDFHGKSQRLAVGTAEGAAIVFDLRTATRLYVLEGHAQPVTALSWSPDGHRLVTVSLEESRVVAWRVSGGLLSMFMAGTPARQGSGTPATPFKTYDFHVGDEALMSTAATLEWVVMDWPAERTVRLRIRETALNFGV